MKKENYSNYDKNKNFKKTNTGNTGEVDNSKKVYAYYSRVLQKPFDTIPELNAAEDAYYAKLKEKEDKALQKKADALKVEEAFKTLNKVRRNYKDSLNALTSCYSKDLENLKVAFQKDKAEVQKRLADAEKAYSLALKDFTGKYPEGYHLTLKDGDFETTISSSCSNGEVSTTTTGSKPSGYTLTDLFTLFFD